MTVSIGIYQPRKRSEVDDVRRAVRPYGVSYTFQIGGFRVTDVPPSMPHVHYRNIDEYLRVMRQHDMTVVPLEVTSVATPLSEFEHPENASYLLGPNTGTLMIEDLVEVLPVPVYIETPNHSALNTSSVAAVLMHDRYATQTQGRKVA